MKELEIEFVEGYRPVFLGRAGFTRIYLWTVEGLSQSLSLYLKSGFEIVDRFLDDRYSVPRTNLLLERKIS